jgi:hypothetical protein
MLLYTHRDMVVYIYYVVALQNIHHSLIIYYDD